MIRNRVLRTWWVQITANPQKASLLGALLVIMVIMGARALLSGGPSRARASSGGDGASSSLTPMDQVLKSDLLKPGGPTVTIVRAGAPERNVFRFDDLHFPPPPVEEPTSRENSGKSESNRPESQVVELTPEEKRQQLELEARKAFSLQSTLVGATPIAVIQTRGSGGTDRLMLSVGQEVKGFVLREVLAHAIIVEKDGTHIEIRRELPER